MPQDILEEASKVCRYALDYHEAMVEVAKDRVHGSWKVSPELDRLYERFVKQARKVLEMMGDE